MVMDGSLYRTASRHITDQKMIMDVLLYGTASRNISQITIRVMGMPLYEISVCALI